MVNLHFENGCAVVALLLRGRLNMENTLACIGFTFMWLSLASAITHASEAAQAKYQSCVACHGDEAQGNTELHAPALAGQDAAYLARQLQHFKAGIRGADPRDTQGAQMKAMVATLSDEDVLVIAEYLAMLPTPELTPEVSGDLKNGNNYYHANCGACHGGEAQGNPGLNAPALAGLDAAYLKTQFQNFRLGIRGAHPEDTYGKQMKMMSNTLPSDKDLDDVIAYIQAQATAE